MITNEALFRACRAYGLGEQFNAAAQDEGTFAEWLDELPIEVAAATARLLQHHARSGARSVGIPPKQLNSVSSGEVSGCAPNDGANKNRQKRQSRDR